jgi:hypothetical protein
VGSPSMAYKLNTDHSSLTTLHEPSGARFQKMSPAC